jgi:tRNA dimethylallyltransferase
MLVYRAMDIGTAKPTRDEIATFRYVGIDLADPDTDFSVGDYLRCMKSRDEKTWIAVGGTGLYVRCLTEGLREVPAANAAIRARAERLLEAGGIAALQGELERLAPGKLASLADPKNPRRLIRALETALPEDSSDWKSSDPKVSSDWKSRTEPQPVLVGLRMERTALERRIRARVGKMYVDGLIDEAAALRKKFSVLSRTALQAIGYAEAFAVLDGRMTQVAAMEQTVIRTRQLAKKQMTWFRRQHRVEWIDVAENDSPQTIADQVQLLWKQYGPATLHR